MNDQRLVVNRLLAALVSIELYLLPVLLSFGYTCSMTNTPPDESVFFNTNYDCWCVLPHIHDLIRTACLVNNFIVGWLPIIIYISFTTLSHLIFQPTVHMFGDGDRSYVTCLTIICRKIVIWWLVPFLAGLPDDCVYVSNLRIWLMTGRYCTLPWVCYQGIMKRFLALSQSLSLIGYSLSVFLIMYFLLINFCDNMLVSFDYSMAI